MSIRPMRHRRAAAVSVALTLAVGGAVFATTPAHAASTYNVSTTAGDDSPGSLIRAVNQANSDPDHTTITFSLPPASTITILSGEWIPSLDADTTITGPGSSQLTIADTDGTSYALNAASPCADPTVLIISGLRFTGFGGGGGFGCTHTELTDIVFDDSGNVNPSISVVDGFFRGTDLAVHANNGGAVMLYNSGADANGMSIVGLEIDGTAAYNGSSINLTAGGAAAHITVSDLTVTGSTTRGIIAGADSGATIALSAVSVSDSAAQGMEVWNSSGGSLTLVGGTFTNNALDAMRVHLDDAEFEVTDVDATSTGSASHGLSLDAVSGSTADVRRISLHDFDTAGHGAAELDITDGSTVEIADSDFLRNTADNGAGLRLAALEDTDSSLTISGSLFADNAASGNGGAIELNQVGTTSAVGGVTIARTAIVQNQAGGNGGGIYLTQSTVNSDNANAPVVLIDRSQVSENEAMSGGGLFLSYGSMPVTPGPIGILNTTINDNVASQYGGGIYASGYNDAELDLAYSTIVGNTASFEGGGLRLDSAGPTDVRVLGSILAGNGAGSGVDLFYASGGVALSTDWSLVQDPNAPAALALTAGTGNIVGVDPELESIANNGGNTLTMLPQAGSPVLDVIDPASVDVPLTDQRDVTRPGGGMADMGAVELPTAALAATGPSPLAPAIAMLLMLVCGIVLLAIRMRVRT